MWGRPQQQAASRGAAANAGAQQVHASGNSVEEASAAGGGAATPAGRPAAWDSHDAGEHLPIILGGTGSTAIGWVILAQCHTRIVSLPAGVRSS